MSTMPQGPGPGPAPKKTSPLVWILLALGGLVVVVGLAVTIGGYFLYQTAKKAAQNPGFAAAKLIVAANPELDLVSTDEGRGTLTVRERKTGKTVIMNFEDIQKGKLTIQEEGKEAVSLEATGDAEKGVLQIKSKEGSVMVGANNAQLPDWLPRYPGATMEGNFAASGGDGQMTTFAFKTKDAAEAVLKFYGDALKQNGFQTTSTTATERGKTSGGMVTASHDASKRSVVVTVGSEEGGTSGTIMVTQKK
ncbi:MAG: hypothetical protein HYS04_05965 [Acidobacteria bacterium]|nr:hypothetical protein [Acidobacteriota bacterium]